MSKQPGRQLTRRTFIKSAGATGATVYVIWSGPALFGTHVALAAKLTALNTAEAKEMLAMARQLFPHDKLGDEYYWVVVEWIDADMAASPEMAKRRSRRLGAIERGRWRRLRGRRRGPAGGCDEETGGHTVFLGHTQ